MGIVTGMTRFLGDYAKEETEEQARWEKQGREAETARRIEGERKTLWSIIGTVLSIPFAGPAAPVVGSIIGNIAKGVGTWKGKDIEDFKYDTDVGKFEKQQKSELEGYNQMLRDADKSEFWKGILDVGYSALGAWKMGGGSFTKEGMKNFDPFKWGGKEGYTTGEAWKMFFDRPEINPYDPIKDPGSYSDWIDQQYS